MPRSATTASATTAAATSHEGSLVDPGGAPRLGRLPATPPLMDLDRAAVRSHGLPLPPHLARLRLKQWQHFALVLPDCFVGLALVDAAYLRKSWCHVVDRQTGRQFEHERTAPAPLLDLRLARQLYDGRCHVRARGYCAFVHNHLAAGEHRLQVHIDGAAGRPEVHADLRCLHDRATIQPLDVVLPVGPDPDDNRGMYTHKVALPLEGSVHVGGRRHDASAADSLAILDIHQAHYPRHTWWNWATGAGRDASGRSVAFNLTRNVNPDDRAHNENALWVDGRLHPLGPASFSFDRARVLEPWGLRSGGGGGGGSEATAGNAASAVDLVFTPGGERSEDLRLGLLRSVFHQPYGTFSGTLRPAGEPAALRVEGLFGVCEDHDALW